MGKCKTKTIQADLGIFTHIMAYSRIFRLSRHIQAHSGIFRNYSGIFWTLCNPGIFRTLLYWASWHIQNQNMSEAYSEPWYIHNCGTFRTRKMLRILSYSESKTYSEPCQASTMEHFEKQLTVIIIFASYDYFCNISLWCPLIHEISIIF